MQCTRGPVLLLVRSSASLDPRRTLKRQDIIFFIDRNEILFYFVEQIFNLFNCSVNWKDIQHLFSSYYKILDSVYSSGSLSVISFPLNLPFSHGSRFFQSWGSYLIYASVYLLLFTMIAFYLLFLMGNFSLPFFGGYLKEPPAWPANSSHCNQASRASSSSFFLPLF